MSKKVLVHGAFIYTEWLRDVAALWLAGWIGMSLVFRRPMTFEIFITLLGVAFLVALLKNLPEAIYSIVTWLLARKRDA